MKRRQLLAGLVAGILVPRSVLAQTAEDQVVNQLRRQGYREITLQRTLLGRTRIVATGSAGRREIILNPSTGAILRDYIDRSDRDRDRDDGTDRGRDRADDDDDDDDRDDDDRDDDRGGRGGGRDDDDDDDDGGDDGDDGGGGDDDGGDDDD